MTTVHDPFRVKTLVDSPSLLKCQHENKSHTILKTLFSVSASRNHPLTVTDWSPCFVTGKGVGTGLDSPDPMVS